VSDLPLASGVSRVAPDGRRARTTLLVAVIGSSMAFLDGTVVNVALPVMQRELGLSVDGAQWVVEAYALLLASLVLVGGVLGDRCGRKLVFLAGVIAFSRGRAIGTWSSFSAITAAIGPVAGGRVVTHASWRWLFFFNVPIAALVIVLAVRGVDETS
jgi:MFS family permease